MTMETQYTAKAAEFLCICLCNYNLYGDLKFLLFQIHYDNCLVSLIFVDKLEKIYFPDLFLKDIARIAVITRKQVLLGIFIHFYLLIFSIFNSLIFILVLVLEK